jgi:hypothetical protein
VRYVNVFLKIPALAPCYAVRWHGSKMLKLRAKMPRWKVAAQLAKVKMRASREDDAPAAMVESHCRGNYLRSVD